jgi:hypothetical protein
MRLLRITLAAIVAAALVAIVVFTLRASLPYLDANTPSARIGPLQTQVALLPTLSPPSTPTTTDQPQVAGISEKDRISLQKDLLQFQTDNEIKIASGWLQTFGVGSIVAIATLFLAWRNFQELRAKNKLDDRKQADERYDSLTERLYAVDDKGEPNLDLRISAIAELNGITRQYPDRLWSVTMSLCGYVRRCSPWNDAPPTPLRLDVQAALRAVLDLNRRVHRDLEPARRMAETLPEPMDAPLSIEIQPEISTIQFLSFLFNDAEHWPMLDLRLTDLRGVELRRPIRLEGLDLTGAHLDGTNLLSAYLTGCNMEDASLRGCQLADATLVAVDLSGARLDKANLRDANLATDVLMLTAQQLLKADGFSFAKLPRNVVHMLHAVGRDYPYDG